MACRGASPQVLKLVELLRSANELGCGEPGAAGARFGRRQQRARWVSLGHEALECLLRRRARGDPELALQD
jgi:hypothetical protein